MSDLNDNRDREGGLFSDDYEIPKRENPYKKKKKTSEDEAEAYVSTEDTTVNTKRENPYKRKKKQEAPAKNPEKIEENREAPPPDASRVFHEEDGAHLEKRSRSLKDRWSDFVFAHVKLMCFIGGVIVLLLFISAPAIYYGVQEAHEAAEKASKETLTFSYIKGLADRAEPADWRDFEQFYYEEQLNENGVTWFVPVGEDERFEVWISGVSTSARPAYVYLYDFDTGEQADLSKGLSELEAFLDGIS